MYCPNCKQEYDGKFCPECGTKLIEKPVASGVSVNLSGDANAISMHTSDSHNVHNEDRSVHNTVNNISQAQKTKDELKQEKLKQYLDACRSALADNRLDPSEEADLRRLSLELDIDEVTAGRLLNEVKQLANSRQQDTELPRKTMRELDKLADNLDNNDVQAIKQQLYGLEANVANYKNDELQYNYYLVLAALCHEKCIEQYESSKVDSYWLSFWVYIAYLKANKPANASQVFYSMPKKFPNQPQDNLDLLAAAGSLIKNNKKDAKDDLEDVEDAYSPLLISFAKSIYFLADPKKAQEMGADENTCAFYLVNFFGQKDAKAKAEEERLKKEAEEAERRKKEMEEQKRKEDEARKKAEEETHRDEAEIASPQGWETVDVVLEKVGDAKLQVVKALKESLDLGLKEAKDFADGAPSTLKEGISYIEAEYIKETVEAAGAFVRIVGREIEKQQPRKEEARREAEEERRRKETKAEKYNYHPKNRVHLIVIIKKLIKERGLEADLNDIDTSEITDMSVLFDSSDFNGNISGWDVSSVTNMADMFNDSKFNGDISKWDVSNVEDMHGMFCDSKFNQDISKWDVSNVKDMGSMFNSSIFNGDISNWDVSNVEDMSLMFAASKFNGDISKWDVSNVEDMYGMFEGSKFFGDISTWDVSNVTDMQEMFCDSIFIGDIPNWDVSNVENMKSMFQKSLFIGDISKWDVSNVEDMEDMFSGSPLEYDPPKWYKG